jgi:hypothetical protein
MRERRPALDIQIAERGVRRSFGGSIPELGIGLSFGGSIRDWLEQSGHRATLISDAHPDELLEGVLLVMGNINWFPNLRRRLEQTPRERRPFVLLWHYEPLPSPRAANLRRPWLSLREIAKIVRSDRHVTDVYSNFATIRDLHRRGLVDQFVMTTRGRQEFLAEQGIPSEWVPLGYQHSHGRPLGLERDIDVLFLGYKHVPRRRRIIRRLESLGVRVLVKGDWHDPSCWGESRTQLLNRTKILLNFPRTEGEMSGARFVLGISNQALVVSEPVYRPDPYIPGQHFVCAPLDQIPDVVAHYLQNEPARTAITATAYEHLMANVRQEQSASALLQLMSGHTP